MNLKFALRSIGILAAAALLITGVSMRPLAAMGTDSPPPTDSGNKKKKKKDNQVIEQQQEQLAQEQLLPSIINVRAASQPCMRLGMTSTPTWRTTSAMPIASSATTTI